MMVERNEGNDGNEGNENDERNERGEFGFTNLNSSNFLKKFSKNFENVSGSFAVNVDAGKRKQVFLNTSGECEVSVSAGENSILQIFEKQASKANTRLNFFLSPNALVEYFLSTNFDRKSEERIVLGGVQARFHSTELLFSNTNASITVVHEAESTESEVKLRGTLKNANAAVKSLTVIRERAANSNAFLSGKFLVFDNSFASVSPELEIRNKNTTSRHEAVVMQVDDEKLFYLTTRGLREQEAEKTLVDSFMNVPKELRDY